MLRVLSLFSGIGAFEGALDEENIDWELDHYCEIDKYACRSYNCIHGTTDEDNLKDVTNIDYSKIGRVDLVTYGFPCQDISLAGNQKGFFNEEGNLTRSGLFFNAADVIRHTKPKFAIFENVKNLTGKKFKAEFETVLSVLDELGYNTYWKVLNAKDYGIPQNRERVFGISIRKDIDHGYEFPQGIPLELRLKDILEDEVDEKYYLWKPKKGNYVANCLRANGALCKTDNSIIVEGNIYPNSGNPQAGRIYNDSGISPSLDTCSGGNRMPKILQLQKGYNKGGQKELCSKDNLVLVPKVIGGIGEKKSNGGKQWYLQDRVYDSELAVSVTTSFNPMYLDKRSGIRRLIPLECWRLMGFKDKYFDRVQGVSNSQLYKQAGNSIVVDVLRAIFRELKNQYPDDFKENDRKVEENIKMKIEAGMKLTVRKDLTEGCYGEVYVTDEMASMAGETVEVSRVCESGKIELKGIEFYWTASMFEEFTEWIKEVLNNHLKWLKNDPAGRRAVLCSANLRGADLRGADLRGADLYGADLRGADLRGADLYGADLRGADLRGAVLCGAVLCSANLYGADLRGAVLCSANLRGADLRGADLRGAEIKDREGNEVKIEKIMSIGPIGSRNDITMVYFTTDKKALVKCGCFYDYLDKFEKAVHRTHAGNQYEKQYMALIELAKTMMEEQ